MRLGLGGVAALSAVNGARAGQARLSAKPVEAKPTEKPLIMLDPGHGGVDPGAIAPDGMYEKWITLYSGHELRKALEKTGRYRVAMTRTSDVYIPLDQRVDDAVKQKANLFLSLHCDHLPEKDLRGASIFTLSNKASDALAAGLAQDDNGFAAAGGPINGAPPQVADILASLETRATKIGSLSLAEDLQTRLKGSVPLLPDPHRSANFAVLRDPSTPAVLLEMGCLTNPHDEARLRDPAQRRKLAGQITLAINSYFDNATQRRMAG